MKRRLRIAAVQLPAHDRQEFARAWPRIVARVEEAAEGAELIVLPEGTIPAYVLGDEEIDDREIDAAVRELCAVAVRHRVAIVAGVAVRDEGGVRNAGLVIDRDGTIAGRADKIFLWHFDRRWFAAGTRLVPIATSLGRLGVLVCADGRMPEIARALVDRGAELLVMPTAWVSSGRDPDALENPIADLLGRMRAFENGVPFVAANKSGTERGMVLYCGKSQIVDDTGAVVALALERGEEILRATLELGEPQPRRTLLPQPVPRRLDRDGIVRVAISAQPLPPDIEQRLEILQCGYAVATGDAKRLALLDAAIPTAIVDDALVLDPAGLPTYRRAGYRLAVWETHATPQKETVARARAGESRMYLIVLDKNGKRAFAADPDYSIVCGTFDDFRIASCAIDLAKVEQTIVAPGTDVAEGLDRVRAMTSGTA
jgi:predicted amidohydrolase